jgi:hypothetical protein
MRTKQNTLMRNPTAYLKMRVLGPLTWPRAKPSVIASKAVSQMTFNVPSFHRRRFNSSKTICSALLAAPLRNDLAPPVRPSAKFRLTHPPFRVSQFS